MALEAPPDFSLTLTQDNGSLPPPHRRSKRLTISATGDGVFTTTRGYGSEGATSRTFHLPLEDVHTLHRDLDALGLFRTPWSESEAREIGGRSTRLGAIADGLEVDVGRVVRNQRSALEAIVARVLEVVPA